MNKPIINLSEEILKSAKEDNKNLTELIEFLNELTTYTLDIYVKESENINSNSVYILKNKGYLEQYNSDKLRYSLEGASAEAGDVAYMNSGDISLIINEVEKNFNNRIVIKSTEIRKWVKDSLEKNGFKKVKESYDK